MELNIDSNRAMRRASLWQPLLSFALKNNYKKIEEAVYTVISDELPGISGIENEVSNYEGLPEFFRLEAQALREEAEERLQKVVDTMYDERIASLKQEKENNERLLRKYEDQEGEFEFPYLIGQETKIENESQEFLDANTPQTGRPLNPKIDEKIHQLYHSLGANIEEIDNRIAEFEKTKQRTLAMLKIEGKTAEQYRKNLDFANKYDALACAIKRFDREQGKPKLSFGPF